MKKFNRQIYPGTSFVYFTFFFFGLVLILLSIICRLINKTNLIENTLLNIGVVFVSTSIIAYIWSKTGGDPIERAFKKYRSMIEIRMRTGVETLLVRGAFDFKTWRDANVKIAERVDMLGNILQDNLTKDLDFVNAILERADSKKCKFRILVLDPESEILKQRAIDESLRNIDLASPRSNHDELKLYPETERMKGEIENTLRRLSSIKEKLKDKTSEYFDFRVVNSTYLCCSIIRADDKMMIINYLHRTGSGSPITEIRGKDTQYFQIYEDEFERIWRTSKPWVPKDDKKESVRENK